MLTERMSYDEIHTQLKDEFDEVHNYLYHIHNKYRRAVMKSSKFPVYFKPIDYVSRKKNNYFIIIQANSRKDMDHLLTIYVCLFRKGGITHAAIYNRKGDLTTVYSGHLFSRYRERFLKDNSLTTVEVIKRFFQRNACNYSQLNGATEEVYSTCEEGVVLGKTEGKHILFKTFVSNDMLFLNQKFTSTYMNSLLQEYKNELDIP